MKAIDFDARIAELDERAETMASIPLDHAQPTEVHRALVGVMHDLLVMVGDKGGDRRAPMPVLVAARMIRQIEGELLEGLAEVPEADVVKMLSSIRDGIDDILTRAGYGDAAAS